MIKGSHYWDKKTGAWEKINDIGLIALFPGHKKIGWLPCNGQVISKAENENYKALVNLLKKEVVDSCSRIVEIEFTKDGDALHPGRGPSFYWIFYGPINEPYYIWYTVGGTGHKPIENMKEIKIDVPLVSNRFLKGTTEEVAYRTSIILSAIEGVNAKAQENVLTIVSDVFCSNINLPVDKKAGIKIYLNKKGSDFRMNSFYHEDADSCRLPLLETMKNFHYLIKYA